MVIVSDSSPLISLAILQKELMPEDKNNVPG